MWFRLAPLSWASREQGREEGQMFDYQNFKLLHRHGPDWVELLPREAHDPAALDPERTWGRGAKLFKCTKCEEEVAIVPADPEELR